MKKFTIIIVSVCFIQSVFAQKVDMVNAPRNPIGFKHKKEHFNLKGDIYASAGKIFDKSGNLTYNYGTSYFYENGEIIGNNYNDTIQYDDYGNIILFKYNSGSTNNYFFNSKNLLIFEKNTYGDEKTYTYDSQDRLLKTVLNRKGIFYQQRDINYSKSGDSLIVELQYTNQDRQPGFNGKYHYFNGHLVKEELSSDTYKYIVDTDSKGNKIDFYTANDPDAKHFKTYNRYYSDANKIQKIEYGYYDTNTSDNTEKKLETIFINNNKATDFVISKGIKENEKVIYDGLTETYYSIENLIDDNNTINTRIQLKTILSSGKKHLSYAYNGSFINYINGQNKLKAREFAFLGPHMIDYRVEKNTGRTFVIENYKNIDSPTKEIKLLTADTTSIIYTRDLEKDNFYIAVKGIHIDYDKARFEYLTSGDPVIFIDEKPLYILTGFKEAKQLEIKIGRTYNNELEDKENIKKEKVSIIEKSESDKAYKCVTGDCENGWGRVTVNDIITDATFKDGAINGLAYISYPNGSYYHGQYVNNRRSGVGYYKWENGNVYIGGWKDGLQHGLGYTMDNQNKITSAGTFENGKFINDVSKDYLSGKSSDKCIGNCIDGFGQRTYDNGDKFWGFFKGKQRNSIGTYLWSNNSVYTGSYAQDGKRNGYGIYTYVDRSVFKGVFIDDEIDGLGVMKYAKSGDVSQGFFNNKGAKIKDF